MYKWQKTILFIVCLGLVAYLKDTDGNCASLGKFGVCHGCFKNQGECSLITDTRFEKFCRVASQKSNISKI